MVKGQLLGQNMSLTEEQEWARHAGILMGIGKTKSLNIISFRCTSCVFLENYAPDEVSRAPTVNMI